MRMIDSHVSSAFSSRALDRKVCYKTFELYFDFNGR